MRCFLLVLAVILASPEQCTITEASLSSFHKSATEDTASADSRSVVYQLDELPVWHLSVPSALSFATISSTLRRPCCLFTSFCLSAFSSIEWHAVHCSSCHVFLSCVVHVPVHCCVQYVQFSGVQRSKEQSSGSRVPAFDELVSMPIFPNGTMCTPRVV